MKRGYKRLLIFEILIFIILILNSFVWNILSSYTSSILLIIILVAFKLLFGFEKDKHRYLKDLLMEVFIFVFIFLMLFYLLGVIISFYRPNNYMTSYSFIYIIIPMILYLILREFARYVFMCKAEGCKLLFVTTVVIFIMFDITTALYVRNFVTNYNIFLFIALTLLPSISLNTVLSYFVLKTGYKPFIMYSLILGTYQYILPIVPNANEYITSIIGFVLPILLGYRLFLFFKNEPNKKIERNYNKNRAVPYLISGVVSIILVYLTCGYFHFWAVAVASGSMSPKIKKGDVVIIEKINGNKCKNYKKGQVIAFSYGNKIVVHRLIDKSSDNNKCYFYTKGDANTKKDNFYLEEKNLIGVVKFKIPYIGIPTVWLNDL